MPRQAIVYRVLIASPSDVVNERKAIPEVIHSWNAVNSNRYGAILEAVLWETHATPEMGSRPQDIINRQIVRESDILVGVFWTRLGTQTGEAESGSVEEINEFKKEGKPVLLYFSSAPVVPESIDLDQYKRLLEFKTQCEAEGLIFQYNSVGNLREQLLGHLTSTIERIHKGEGIPASVIAKEKGDVEKESLKAFRSQFESFLRRLEAEWIAERDSEPMDIEDAKYMLGRAFDEVVNFKAQIVSDQGTGLSDTLTEAAKRIKQLQRHQLYLDGGISYNEFWKEGNLILELLKKVPQIIDEQVGR